MNILTKLILKKQMNHYEKKIFYIVKFDKLEYFYKKFGFEVIFNDIKSQGIIKLKLNKKNL